MGPLIDQELERVDRKHAQLTQLSSDLVEALNLYHTLMREPGAPQPYHTLPKQVNYGYPPPPAAHVSNVCVHVHVCIGCLTGIGWREKFHNKDHPCLYFSPIVKVIKSRRMKWAEHVVLAYERNMKF